MTELAASAPEEAFAPTPPAWTLHNRFLLALACSSGRGRSSVIVDGQPTGLSARLFEEAAAAARRSGDAVNDAWLEHADAEEAVAAPCSAAEAAGSESALLLAASLGNRLNHGTGSTAQATFEMVPLPRIPSPALRRFLPALGAVAGRPHRGAFAGGSGPEPACWVPLLQARTALCVAPGDPPLELLVDYGANPLQLGYEYA